MYKVLISDFDGTLFDTQKAISTVLQETFKERRCAVPSRGEMNATISLGLTLDSTFEALLPELKKNSEARYEWVRHYRKIYNSGLGITASQPFTGLIDTLKGLRDCNVPVIVVSNKGETAIWKTLRHFAVDNLVMQVVAANSALSTKPHSDSFLKRILPNYESMQANEFLVFGDTTTDMQYARTIGAGAAYASYGYGEAQHCLRYKPDLVINEMQSLLKVFQ